MNPNGLIAVGRFTLCGVISVGLLVTGPGDVSAVRAKSTGNVSEVAMGNVALISISHSNAVDIPNDRALSNNVGNAATPAVTLSVSDSCGGPVIHLSGYTIERYVDDYVADGTIFDRSGWYSDAVGNGTNNAFNVGGGDPPPYDVCVFRGVINGHIPLDWSWDQAHSFGGSGDKAYTAHLALADGTRIHNVEDGWKPRELPEFGNTGIMQIRNSYMTGIRDDAIENDDFMPGVIEDSLFDGVRTFLSEQNQSGGTPLTVGPNEDPYIRLNRVYVRLYPTNSNGTENPGYWFKWQPRGSVNHSLIITDSVFAADMLPNSGWDNLDFPAGTTFVGTNYVLWLGTPGQYGATVPAGVIFLEGQAALDKWNQVRNNWLTTHGYDPRPLDDLNPMDDPVVAPAIVPISGHAGVANATLSYMNGVVRTATADSNGNYSFKVPYNWSGTVTPSKPGYIFSPIHRTYVNVTTNQAGQDYTATPIYTISGNAGAPGVHLNYSVGTTALSQADGSYTIPLPSGWSGTVTPALAGVTFTPASRSYSNLTTDQTVQNYTAAVTLAGNVGVAGATLSYVNGTAKNVTADGNGNYAITLPYGWSGTVTPAFGGAAFCPVSQSYTHLQSSQAAQHYAHKACPQYHPLSGWTSDFSYSPQGWRADLHPRVLGDVDGDGKQDVVGFGYGGVLVALSNGTGFNPATSWTTDFSYNQGWRMDTYPRLVGDVNGDGKDDVVGFGYAGAVVALSTGSSFAPLSLWTTDFSYYPQGWRASLHPRGLGDVNGDGKDDIVGFGYGGVLVALSNGAGFDPVTSWTTDFSYNQGWRMDTYPRLVGDVNGDGNADVVGFGYAGAVVAVSNGSGFEPLSLWTSDFSYYPQGWRADLHPREIGDVNGDGKEDIVGFGYGGVLVALSNGSGFTLVSTVTTDFSYNQGWRMDTYPRMLGDVNGDGQADLVGFGHAGVLVATAK